MFEPSVTVPDHLAGSPGRWFLFDDRRRLLLIDGEIPASVDAPLAADDPLVLGHDQRGPAWTARVDQAAVVGAPDAALFVDLRQAFDVLAEEDWLLAGRASQILTWDADHGFCGRCGAETVRHPGERARACPACDLLSFPRLTPAVITLVEREDGQALLAWGRQFPGRFFSALAGFVEPGENLEDTVAREVREESGVEVTNVRYFGSQPWPFPHSLMIGFNADYAGGELRIQESEIVEAGWFRHDELPPVPRGRMSIAGWLIEDWVARRSGA
ncbi:MAG: NAD(+) diphosphatase [Actinomycetota bacterium]